MFDGMTRSDLESQARRLGYEPDRDDTDADLTLAIHMRSARAGQGSPGDAQPNGQGVFPPYSTANG